MLKRDRITDGGGRGQALVELALVFPLFTMVLIGIIVLGLGLFYQQQVTNAAREGARYAAIHSATNTICPTVSHLDPDLSIRPQVYYRCDPPELGWPEMTAHVRQMVFGIAPTDVHVAGCWSGYWTKDGLGNWADYDAPPPDSASVTTYFRQCTIGGIDPTTGLDMNTSLAAELPCPPPVTAPSDDMASNYSASNGATANEVTVYACYEWEPPLAGFLLIPDSVTIRAVVSEGMQYQQ